MIAEVKSRPGIAQASEIICEHVLKQRQIMSLRKGIDVFLHDTGLQFDLVRLDLFVVYRRCQNT